jgi:hypothetical protein
MVKLSPTGIAVKRYRLHILLRIIYISFLVAFYKSLSIS